LGERESRTDYLEMFPVHRRPGRTLISDQKGLKRRCESDEDLAQQKAEPADQAAEVLADSGEDGVGRTAAREPCE